MLENEPDLIRQARAGDKEAYNQLCKDKEKELYDYVFNRIADKHHPDAEDCLQEILIRGWLNLKTYQGEDIMPWFYGIANNLKKEWCRKKEKRKEFSFPVDKETGEVLEPASADPPPDEVYRQEHQEENEVVAAINRLPLQYRAILTYMAIEDFTIDETIPKIKQFADTKDKVKKLRIKAREMLRLELKKRNILIKKVDKEVDYEEQ